MMGAGKVLAMITVVQLAVIPGCSSLVLKASNELLIASPASTPKTRSDCDSPETGWKIEKLNGKVKSLQEEEIEYRYGPRKKELTRLVTFGPDGDYLRDEQRKYYSVVDYSKINKPSFIFDKQCRVLEKRDPKRPDRMAGATRSVFSYMPGGTLTEESIYDSEGRLLWKSVAVLDKNERVIETDQTIQEHPEHYNPKRYDVYRNTKSLYKLDNTGNQVEEISYNWEGKLYATYKRAYDSARHLTRELRLDHKNRPIDLKIYRFTETGVLQEELQYTSAGYSDIDELIPGTLDSGYGLFQDGYRIVYEYDKANNWVKKTEFDLARKGEISNMTYRSLAYY